MFAMIANTQAGADLTYLIPVPIFIAGILYGFFVRKRPVNR